MDETPDLTLPTPVVVWHRAARPASSLTWSLAVTTVVVGLAALAVLSFAIDSLGYGALVVLAPLGGSTPAAPEPAHYVVTLTLASAAGLVVAVVGSVLWDRRSPSTPAAVRGLVVGAAASVVAAAVLALGLGLV